jgi:hypothetical protein
LPAFRLRVPTPRNFQDVTLDLEQILAWLNKTTSGEDHVTFTASATSNTVDITGLPASNRFYVFGDDTANPVVWNATVPTPGTRRVSAVSATGAALTGDYYFDWQAIAV